jgi:putative peptidoglycan lipid II flippase
LSQSSKAAKSIFIMIILTIGSKVSGFVREMLIAAKFGSGFETDTFFIALSAIGLFTSIFTLSLNTTVIPIMSDIEKNEGKEGKIHHVNNLQNIVIMISIVVVILGWFFAPLITKIIANGFKGEQFNLAVTMIRIGLPAVIFSGVVGINRGYLQSESKFLESSISKFPHDITYIFFLLVLTPFYGIKGLMLFSVIAVFSQILPQISGIKKLGYKYEFKVDIKDKYIRKMLYLVLPVLASVAVNDINKIIDRSLASTLIEGSISSLNYAARLNTLALGIFVTSIATVLYPMFSIEATRDTYDNFKKLLRQGTNVIILITVPITIGIIVLSEPIVKLAFERGAFDTLATNMTSQALIFYTLGLLGMSLRMFMERAYYSLQDTRTPMINGMITVALNIVLNLLLIGPMQYRGLALATSIATTLTTGYLYYRIRQKIGSFRLVDIIKCLLKSIAASVIMGVLVYYSYSNLIAIFGGNTIYELVVLLLSIFLGALVYFVILYLLRVNEMTWFINLFKNKFLKRTK